MNVGAVAFLGLLATVGGFLFFQRITVVCYHESREIPWPVYPLRFLCKLGAIFFGLAALGTIVGR